MTHVTAGTPEAVSMGEIGEESVVRSLLDLLDRARADIDRDAEAAKNAIRQASAILRVELERSTAQPETDGGGLAVWQVRRVIAYIDAHLSERIPVKELGRVAQRSASHFCRAFKKTMGETPYSFITRRRLAVAERLMLTSDAALSEIAILCGFADQSHFSNRFREATGRSPAAWRRERRESIGRSA
jgi:AraC-like DNA-binding protein